MLALQTGLIDSHQFIDCCSAWIARKRTPLANLLIERGWILPGDKDHVDYLLERKLQKHGDAVNAGLAVLGEDVKRSLASLGDADIERSLADLTQAYDSPVTATVSGIPAPQERYSMTCMHAAGGIGRVWLARDQHLGRDVAFNDLRPEHIGNLAIRARFLQEARITGQLEHPGIVPIYELNEQLGDRRPFYTMRFIEEGSRRRGDLAAAALRPGAPRPRGRLPARAGEGTGRSIPLGSRAGSRGAALAGIPTAAGRRGVAQPPRLFIIRSWRRSR